MSRKTNRIRAYKKSTENIKGAGTLPWQRTGNVDWKDTSATYYLHSSIQGFYDDYNSLTHQNALGVVFDHLAKEAEATSRDNIKKLKEIATTVKMPIFKATSADQPIEETPLGQVLLGTGDAEKEESLTSAFIAGKHALDWETFEDEVINKLNRDYLKVTTHKTSSAVGQAFYSAVGQRINNSLMNLQAKLAGRTDSEDIKQVYQQITDILQEAAAETGDAAEGFKNAIIRGKFKGLFYGNHRFQLASLMGRAYEDAIAATMQSCLGDAYEAIRTGTLNHLSDVVIKRKADFDVAVPVPQFGISAKLRRNNYFSFQTQVQPQEALDRVANELGADTNAVFNELAFVYNNIIALSIWNSTDNGKQGMKRVVYKITHRNGKRVKYKAHQSTSVESRRTALLDAHTKLGKFFNSFTRYINILMYNTAFFGNRLDAGDVSIFNPQFLANIQSGYAENNGKSAPPAFILTAGHLYETWRVFQHFLDAPKNTITTGELFTDWLHPTHPYNATMLIKLHDRKVDLLRKNSEDTIYGRLFDGAPSIMDMMPSRNLFAELYANAKNRKIEKTIKLADYY